MHNTPHNDGKANKDPGSRTKVKKQRVYFEDLKARHTSHWDWDYLPQAELDKLLAAAKRKNAAGKSKKPVRPNPVILPAALLGMALGLAGIALGLFYIL